MDTKTLPISALRLDGGTQSRAHIDPGTVEDYAEDIGAGAKLPPVIAYFDGVAHWLADGFHRVHASLKAKRAEIDVEVRQGTQRDAILHSVGANSAHGLRRTSADKRRAVRCLLEDEEWRGWSDSEIGRRCNVHHSTVAQVRRTLYPAKSQDEESRKYERGGKVHKQKKPKKKRAPEMFLPPVPPRSEALSVNDEQIGPTPPPEPGTEPPPPDLEVPELAAKVVWMLDLGSADGLSAELKRLVKKAKSLDEAAAAIARRVEQG